MFIDVPPGAAPGDRLSLVTNSNQNLTVLLPPGATPGKKLSVTLPAAAAGEISIVRMMLNGVELPRPTPDPAALLKAHRQQTDGHWLRVGPAEKCETRFSFPLSAFRPTSSQTVVEPFGFWQLPVVRGHVPITENWALDGAATRLGGSPFALGGVEFELALEGRAVPWTPKDGAEGACRDLEICLVVRRMPQAAGASEAKPALAIWLHLVAGDRWSGWQVAAAHTPSPAPPRTLTSRRMHRSAFPSRRARSSSTTWPTGAISPTWRRSTTRWAYTCR